MTMPTLDEILSTITKREEAITDVQDTVAQDWKNFSRVLTNMLSAADISHAKFSKRMGIHESRFCRLLKGKRHWSFKLARKAIATLNPANGN